MKQNNEIIKELAELLLKNSKESEADLTNALAEARRTISVLSSLSKTITQLRDVAQLKMENAAFRYATTYRLNKESREMLRMRYEQALRAIEVGANTFDLILRTETLENQIIHIEKQLEQSKSARDELSVNEIDTELAALDGFITTIKAKEALLKTMRPNAIKKEAEKQGFDISDD